MPESVAVVVPAHNEDRLIAGCLESVQRAVSHLRGSCPDPPDVRLIVVLDACTDGTARAARAVADVRTLVVHHRRVGAARRAGARLALARAPGCWLASTDADSTVPEHWLAAMVGFARDGADLVVGTVQPDAALEAVSRRRWRRGYRNADGHPHVHGANLGISAGAYRALGGWPGTACREDVILVRRAMSAGLSIVRTGAITVTTSSRLTGRAPGGFAAHLAALSR